MYANTHNTPKIWIFRKRPISKSITISRDDISNLFIELDYANREVIACHCTGQCQQNNRGFESLVGIVIDRVLNLRIPLHKGKLDLMSSSTSFFMARCLFCHNFASAHFKRVIGVWRFWLWYRSPFCFFFFFKIAAHNISSVLLCL